MDWAKKYADRAQRWHDTDHGKDRGKALRRSKFVQPVADEPLPEVPADFRDCRLCHPVHGGEPDRHNPFWFRVMAWETPGT